MIKIRKPPSIAELQKRPPVRPVEDRAPGSRPVVRLDDDDIERQLALIWMRSRVMDRLWAAFSRSVIKVLSPWERKLAALAEDGLIKREQRAMAWAAEEPQDRGAIRALYAVRSETWARPVASAAASRGP